MKKWIFGGLLLLMVGVFVLSQIGKPSREVREQVFVENKEFSNPQAVVIQGYNGTAMEPFISRDGQYLFFNNSNDRNTNTNLHYAKRISDTAFTYVGEVAGANSPKLDGVVSMDSAGNFYFVSTRSYEQTFNTLYKGVWNGGSVEGVSLLKGVSREKPYWLNMDAEISPDGSELYYVDNKFGNGGPPEVSDIFVATKNSDGSFNKTANSEEIFYNVNNGDLNYAPSISKDGLELYFTRAKVSEGLVQIYVSKRASKSDVFGSPQLVSGADGFVEGPTLSADGTYLYYHKKISGDSYGIFVVTRP